MKRGESFISANNLNFLPWFLVYNDFLIIIHHDDYQQALKTRGAFTLYIIFQEAIGMKIEEKIKNSV